MIHAFVAGQCIDERYVIVKSLGSGRTSVVYEVLDKKTNSTAALKVLDPMIIQDSVHIERFRREAKILRQIQGAQVVQVYEIVENEDLKYLVLEKFNGVDLKTWLAAEGRIPVERFRALAIQILKTISICHGSQVIHRDLKPHNIMMDKDFNIKVVDFGISRMTTMTDLTKTGTVLGTPEYLAPECFSSSNSDLRQDIYSLGCVFYELLVGHPPFHGDNLQQVFQKKLMGEYVEPSAIDSGIPKYLCEIIKKCLEIDLNRRYQNVTEIISDLDKSSVKNRSLPAEEQVKCLHCNTTHIPGADFCYHCGKYSVEIFQDGPYSVIVTRCERKDLPMRYIHRNYPSVQKSNLISQFSRLPILISKNISEGAAQLIQNELGVMPLEVAITKNLPKDFELPPIYFLLAIMMLSPIFIIQDSILLQALTVIGAETLLYSFYRLRTLPVINHRSIKNRIKKDVDDFWLKSLKEIAKIEDQKVQAILGHILYHYSQFQTTHQKRLSIPICKIIDIGVKSNELYDNLKSTQIIQLQRKIEIAALQIKNEKMPEKIDALIKIKSDLVLEYRSYRKLAEAYGDFYNFLLGQLENIEHFDGHHLPDFNPISLEIFDHDFLSKDLFKQEMPSLKYEQAS